MVRKTNTAQRIGIYSGSFDPVHAGHVSFALQAIAAGNLDVVYFLPERRPRDKAGVEHFGHRVAMLGRAAKPHRRLDVLELEDVSFSVAQTLPRLKKHFPKGQLVLLVGSDVALKLPNWPNYEQLCSDVELVVGVREGYDMQQVEQVITAWPRQPKSVMLIESYAAAVSSGKIREALRLRQAAPGLLKSVERYSDHNWLYVSLASRV